MCAAQSARPLTACCVCASPPRAGFPPGFPRGSVSPGGGPQHTKVCWPPPPQKGLYFPPPTFFARGAPPLWGKSPPFRPRIIGSKKPGWFTPIAAQKLGEPLGKSNPSRVLKKVPLPRSPPSLKGSLNP